ncbi:heat shock transcription factor, X-linked member 3-like [Hipposideros larvatus]
MARRSTYETDEAKLAPFGEGEPATGPQDNPPPKAPNQGAVNVEGNRAILGFSFPRKLRMIVEDDTFTSVRWNEDGDMVIIEKYLFQGEILSRKGAERIFETDSLKTFIRLMNLYGFSKIRPNDPSDYSPGNKRVMMYHNCNFQRDKPLLIKCAKEADKRAQEEGPNAQGPSMFSDILSIGNTARCAMEDSSSSYGSVMSLYHKCYSILLAGLSVMAPHEAPEEDVEDEGSSDYKSAFCLNFLASSASRVAAARRERNQEVRCRHRPLAFSSAITAETPQDRREQVPLGLRAHFSQQGRRCRVQRLVRSPGLVKFRLARVLLEP